MKFSCTMSLLTTRFHSIRYRHTKVRIPTPYYSTSDANLCSRRNRCQLQHILVLRRTQVRCCMPGRQRHRLGHKIISAALHFPLRKTASRVRRWVCSDDKNYDLTGAYGGLPCRCPGCNLAGPPVIRKRPRSASYDGRCATGHDDQSRGEIPAAAKPDDRWYDGGLDGTEGDVRSGGAAL